MSANPCKRLRCAIFPWKKQYWPSCMPPGNFLIISKLIPWWCLLSSPCKPYWGSPITRVGSLSRGRSWEPTMSSTCPECRKRTSFSRLYSRIWWRYPRGGKCNRRYIGLVGHCCPLMESLYGRSFQPKGSRSRGCVNQPWEINNGEIITIGILGHQQWGQIWGLASRNKHGPITWRRDNGVILRL